MNKTISGIIYQGISLIDHKTPIVVVATTNSRNEKTGGMVQTWILRADMLAHEAIHTGEDYAICGNCPHRGTVLSGRSVRRSCYVLVHNAPRAVSAKYLRGGYQRIDPRDMGRDRKVRIGSYGDPAAVPARVWYALISESLGHTGYTHQWAHMRASRRKLYQPLVMASADTIGERERAQAQGWRTFRVTRRGELPAQGEISCPASKEAGHKTTCERCGLCAGTTSKARVSVAINLH